MKTISPALTAHLAGNVTSLAACWRIVRTDGQVFAYTTLDADLVISGITYHSVQGFSQSALSTGSNGSVDNLQVIGFFDADGSQGGIQRIDLVNNLFDYAAVYYFVVNWRDLSQGIMKMRRGWLGETTSSPDGTFMAELRGLIQALVQEFGNVLTPYCRADLGDDQCKVPILPATWQPIVTYPVGALVKAATQSTDILQEAIFEMTGPHSGAAGLTEPAWNTDWVTPGITTDATLLWTARRPLRLKATVAAGINTHTFVSSLIYPGNPTGNTASITVRNNISAGSAIEISDGGPNPPIVALWSFATAGSTVAAAIISQINAAIAAGTTTIRITGITGSTNIALRNSGPWQGSITKTGDIANPSALLINDFQSGYLDGGTITWITGANAGASIEIKNYDANTSTVHTWLGMNYVASAGDTFWYYPGCDKTRQTCYAKYNNILNFRGEPDIPGLDTMLMYPDVS